MGGNLADLTYYYFGINFIFFAMAIGGFFLLPNVYSYSFVIGFTPVLMFILVFINKLLSNFGITSFSLPFCLLATGTLFILQYRKVYNLLIPIINLFLQKEL